MSRCPQGWRELFWGAGSYFGVQGAVPGQMLQLVWGCWPEPGKWNWSVLGEPWVYWEHPELPLVSPGLEGPEQLSPWGVGQLSSPQPCPSWLCLSLPQFPP